MQISPSANLFRALGGLTQAQGAAAVNPPQPAPAQPLKPAAPARQAAMQPPPIAAQPAAPPPANLPRGSLLNIKV